jgi:tRNA G18 (ribose-2'-O)-methylase SpoU
MTVGPHPEPWPDDPRLDPELLANGDTRNVTDRYRYWRREAIVADLDRTRRPLHVAIENWQHDFNIGSIVRTANAFNVAAVHIVGRRKWNRRGAMVTDRYMHIIHHPDLPALVAWATERSLPIVGIDIVDGSRPIEGATLPSPCLLLFGQEGPGLSPEAISAAVDVFHITQSGSTRSMNAGAAAAITMFEWVRQRGQRLERP